MSMCVSTKYTVQHWPKHNDQWEASAPLLLDTDTATNGKPVPPPLRYRHSDQWEASASLLDTDTATNGKPVPSSS